MYEPSHHLLSQLIESSHFTKPNVLVVGTGEYVTGYVHSKGSESDKPIGVVALSLFDLRKRGLISNIILCGTNGTKFPFIRQHLSSGMKKLYSSVNESDLQFESFPEDDVECEEQAYKRAMSKLTPGDIVIIFTPDHTHFDIAKHAMESNLHVLCAKPLVQKLEHHLVLSSLQRSKNVICSVEVHKRWDPIYQDARERIAQGGLGNFSFFNSYMSQPATQLHTFKHWASHSDISYYLNAHHIDFHTWALCSPPSAISTRKWRPTVVTACGSYGVANSEPFNIDTEDSITLTVHWKQMGTENRGTAIYTSSWVAPKSDVHSQQRFFYQGTAGEVNVDQAHRGYSMATDQTGFKSVNPLFMKYTPDANMRFAGHTGYGYRSLAAFVEAVFAMRNDLVTLNNVIEQLPTVASISTMLTSAILEAGRMSLDKRKVSQNSEVEIVYDEELNPVGFS